MNLTTIVAMTRNKQKPTDTKLNNHTGEKIMNKILPDEYSMMTPVQSSIYGSRLILIFMYFGLMLAGLAYCAKFLQEVVELMLHFWKFGHEELLLAVLGLVDMVMIGNLIKMIVIGSYSTFVAQFKFPHDDDRPQWLAHMSAGALKVKMGMSLIGVSTISLLQTFINAEHVSKWEVIAKISIHMVFVFSTMALAWMDKMSHPVEDHHKVHNPDSRIVDKVKKLVKSQTDHISKEIGHPSPSLTPNFPNNGGH